MKLKLLFSLILKTLIIHVLTQEEGSSLRKIEALTVDLKKYGKITVSSSKTNITFDSSEFEKDEKIYFKITATRFTNEVIYFEFFDNLNRDTSYYHLKYVNSNDEDSEFDKEIKYYIIKKSSDNIGSSNGKYLMIYFYCEGDVEIENIEKHYNTIIIIVIVVIVVIVGIIYLIYYCYKRKKDATMNNNNNIPYSDEQNNNYNDYNYNQQTQMNQNINNKGNRQINQNNNINININNENTNRVFVSNHNNNNNYNNERNKRNNGNDGYSNSGGIYNNNNGNNGYSNSGGIYNNNINNENANNNNNNCLPSINEINQYNRNISQNDNNNNISQTSDNLGAPDAAYNSNPAPLK